MKVITMTAYNDGHVQLQANVEVNVYFIGSGPESSLVAWCKSADFNDGAAFPLPPHFIKDFCRPVDHDCHASPEDGCEGCGRREV